MFSASDVKDLRERTGAGMLDCKKALDATSGDIEKAIDWLREKGISKAAKKESRIAAEGLCGIKENGKTIAMVEVNSETDFVAKNDAFKQYVDYLLDAILTNDVKTVEDVLALSIEGETVADHQIAIVAKIGEKVTLRRFVKLERNEDEAFGSYLHMGGKIGAITVLKGADEQVARDVAMHAAAMAPICVTREEVPADVLERESTVIKEQVMNEGKPAEIAEKMVTGRLNKFYKEICLLEQAFVKDADQTVEAYVKANGGTVEKMARFAVGEGIEKKQEDFASEVMSQINQN